MLLVLMSNHSKVSAASVAGSLSADADLSFAVHHDPSPNELRAARLRIVGEARGYRLTIEDIADFIERYNGLIDAGRKDPEKGIRGIKDAYDLTLYTVLCEISTHSIAHVDVNKCKTIEHSSPEFRTADADITSLLMRANEPELSSPDAFMHRLMDVLASSKNAEQKERDMSPLIDAMDRDQLAEFLRAHAGLESLTDTVLNIDRITSSAKSVRLGEIDAKLTECQESEEDHVVLKLAKERCRNALAQAELEKIQVRAEGENNVRELNSFLQRIEAKIPTHAIGRDKVIGYIQSRLSGLEPPVPTGPASGQSGDHPHGGTVSHMGSTQDEALVAQQISALEARKVGSMTRVSLELLRAQVEGILVGGNVDFKARQKTLLTAIDTKLYPRLIKADDESTVKHDQGFNFKTQREIDFVPNALFAATLYYDDDGDHGANVEEVRSAFNLCFGTGRGPQEHVIITGNKHILMILLKSANRYINDNEGMPAVGKDLNIPDTCGLVRLLKLESLVADFATVCRP